MFVIKFIYTTGINGRLNQYYLGGSYAFGGERYACIGSREMAKQYKSAKIAESVFRRLSENLANYPEEFEIEEIG